MSTLVTLKNARTGCDYRHPIEAEAEREILSLIAASERLAAIKRLREETAAPVSDCRAWVEERLPPCPLKT